MRAAIAVITALLGGGCDTVFGVSGDPGPCSAASFAMAPATEIVNAESFSVSRDGSFAVVTSSGVPYQLALPHGDLQPIDLGVYPAVGLALAPDGDSLFYTAAIEPPLLRGALRADASWSLDATVPHGTYVGTPSAGEYGPRRLLVRLRDAQPLLQEYEDDGGVWTAHGDAFPFAGELAPNLTPTGLTMVYAAFDVATGEHPVFLAMRASLDEAFGTPVEILPGKHSAPQLLDVCRALYVIDNDEVLRRYDRP